MRAWLRRMTAWTKRALASIVQPRTDQPKVTTTFEEWMTSVQRIDITTLSAVDLDGWRKSFDAAKARWGVPDLETLQHEYFRAALQHQIAARFAVLSGFNPSAGVMFHLAIELYIKGLLCKRV